MIYCRFPRMRSPFVRTLVFLYLATGAPLLQAQEPTLLWKFAVGDEHRYQLNQRMTMKLNVLAAGSVESTVEQLMDLTWRVEAVDEAGTATIAQRISRVQLDVRMPGKLDLHYDTADDDEPSGFAAMLAPMLKALESSVVKVTITRRGEITSIEVPPRLLEAMSRMPGGATLGDLATVEGWKQMLQSNILVLPAREDLKPDFEWTRATQVKSPQVGSVSTSTAYRYEGPREVDGEWLAAFVFAAELEFNELPEDVTIDADSQETAGEVLFSPDRGRQVSSWMRQRADWVMSVAGKPVEQVLDQTVEFRRLADKDE